MSSDQRRSRPVKVQRASAKIRGLLGDIQDTMGMPWVSAMWRTYANYPGVMQLFWERLKPAVAAEPFLREALRISEHAYRDTSNWYHPGFQPDVPAKERHRIEHELDALEFGNPQLLIQQAVLSRVFRGEAVGQDEAAEPRHAPSAYREPEIEMVEERDAPDAVKETYKDIKQTLDLPLVNSDYQAMGKWPSFLRSAWEDVKQWRQRDEYRQLEQEIARMADEAAARLRPAVRIDRAELIEALGDPDKLDELEQTSRMFAQLLPALIVNDALFRMAAAQRRRPVAGVKAGTEQPEAEQRPRAAGERRERAPRAKAAAEQRREAARSRRPAAAGKPSAEAPMEYAFRHFNRQAMMHDTSLGSGPTPGQPMPEFDLLTTDGGHVRKSDFVGTRPLLLTFGSITDPMAASAAPALKRLHTEFGDKVAFVTLYVREAHPGDRYPQPKSFEDKLDHARSYRERHRIPWMVAVDSVEGDLHRALGANSNAAYLMDTEGNVAFRALWSNDEQALREPLESMAFGLPPAVREREPMVVPLLKGAGVMHEVLDLAGEGADEDVLREMPSLYALALLASVFRPLSPLGRGIAALATGTLGLTALLGGIGWLLTRRR